MTANTPARSSPPLHPMPFVRLELVILSVQDGTLQVLLSHRKEDPQKGKWGLPGGVLRIDTDKNLELAAQRVATERLGSALPNLSQVAAVGGPERYKERAAWGLSVIYRSLVQPDLQTTPGKRVQALQWRPVDDVVTSKDIAFDHAALIGQAVDALRHEIRELKFPQGWMPEEFTLSELQALSESVLGERLDKVTFRRRMEVGQIAVALEGKMRTGGAFRPAQLYVLASR